MIEINISTEAPCARAYHCITISEKERDSGWTKGKELYVADGQVFVRVKIATPSTEAEQQRYRRLLNVSKPYFMQCVTGALYCEDGRCLTTSQIAPRKFVRNDELGRKILAAKIKP
jgi:hypothetical protein